LDKVDGLSLIRNSTCRAVVCVALISAAAALVGCGNAYRATISTNNPTPVPTEPLYLPVVLSSAGSSSQGAVTLFESPGEGAMLDLSGDTVLDLVNVGIAPVALAEGTGGGIAYAVDLGSTVSPYIPAVSSFVITPSTQTASVSTTALNTGATIFTPLAPTQPTPCIAATPPPAVFANASLIYVSQTAVSQTGTTQILPLSRNISGTGVPALEPALTTSGVVANFTGLTSGTTAYAIERDSGTVDAIAISQTSTPPTPYIIATLSGFTSPTFGVTAVNGHRVFILNCSNTATTKPINNGTVTPINAQTNTVLPSITIPATANQSTAGNPIWADYYNGGNLLVTANTTGTASPGSVSIINVAENAQNFGAVLGTAAVGNNPSGVVVLQDGTRAYVANEGDDCANTTPGPCPGTPSGGVTCNCKSVSIVSLSSNTTLKTLPLYFSDSIQQVSCPANGLTSPVTSTVSPTGYPLQIATAPDTVDEKVYVLCDQPNPADNIFYVFVIRTFVEYTSSGQSSPADVVSAVIPIQGIPTQLRMTPAR
jgi:hypothetical protein